MGYILGFFGLLFAGLLVIAIIGMLLELLVGLFAFINLFVSLLIGTIKYIFKR